MQPGRSFGGPARKGSREASGQPPPVLRALGEEKRGGPRGGLEGQRAEAAREWQGSPSRHEPAEAAIPGCGRGRPGAGGLGRGGRTRAASESRVPGTWRASPRAGRGSGSAGRCGAGTERGAAPGGGWGARGRREVGSGARGSCGSAHGSPPVRVASRRDPRLPEDGGVGEGGRPGGRGRGRGLEAGAGSAAASSTRGRRARRSSGAGGRGRELSDLLASAGRHSDSD